MDGRVLILSKTKDVAGQDRMEESTGPALINTGVSDRSYALVGILSVQYVYVVSSIHWSVGRDHGNGVKDRCRRRGN